MSGTNLLPEPKKGAGQAVDVINFVRDSIEYLLSNNRLLTATGVQYNVADAGASITTVQNVEADMYTFVLDRMPAGLINYLEFGLTVALLQVTGAVNGVYKWYVRQKGATAWTNIYTSGLIALPAAYDEVSGTCLGKFKPGPAISYPIEIKLTLTTDGETNMGRAKVNASSFVRAVLQ